MKVLPLKMKLLDDPPILLIDILRRISKLVDGLISASSVDAGQNEIVSASHLFE